jgi:hypothetical protein
MSRYHCLPLLLPALIAGCAASGDRERPLPFPKETYGVLLTEFKRVEDEGSRSGCGTVGFELDNAGKATNYKVFYSAPDARFAQKEIDALSAVQFAPDTQPRRRFIDMTAGHNADDGVPATCNRHDFKQAGRQATAEGYLQ